jgi:hypothetical protein
LTRNEELGHIWTNQIGALHAITRRLDLDVVGDLAAAGGRRRRLLR